MKGGRCWARHEVRRHRAGAKRLNHPLIVCGAAPGSPDAEALSLLASWNATDKTENTTLRQT